MLVYVCAKSQILKYFKLLKTTADLLPADALVFSPLVLPLHKNTHAFVLPLIFMCTQSEETLQRPGLKSNLI